MSEKRFYQVKDGIGFDRSSHDGKPNCNECPMADWEGSTCQYNKKNLDWHYVDFFCHPDCPLVEIETKQEEA